MAFTSQLYPNELIIHDTTPEHVIMSGEQGRGLMLPMSHSEDGGNYGETADPFPDELMIPESEWQARIQEMEERQDRISDICIREDLPCKDQQQTSYCWINAPTHCNEITIIIQNPAAKVILSPASAGAQIKNYRNQGGWGLEGLQWISVHGQNTVDEWPANAIDRKYATDANKASAMFRRVSKWMELKPKNKAQMISLLLHRIPGAAGLNWWSHEVTYCDPVWLDGTAVVRARNSWGMGYGTKGFFILQGSKMMADDLVAPMASIAA